MLDELIPFIKLILSATETSHIYDWRAVFEVLLILHTKLWSWRHLKEKLYVWKPKYFKYSSLLKEYSEFYNSSSKAFLTYSLSNQQLLVKNTVLFKFHTPFKSRDRVIVKYFLLIHMWVFLFCFLSSDSFNFP